MIGDVTRQTAHRPWPLPAGPWVMAQTWSDLLFAHWSLPPDVLRAVVPPALELDIFDGQGWLGIVPFRMSGVRPRLVPPVPWLSAFPELNVRTYVRAGGKGGVYFFSLDAANPVAVALARRFFHLPYFRARMRCLRRGNTVHYRSERTHGGVPGAAFAGAYGPTGAAYRATAGSLEHWLTERYCLYAVDARQQIYRADIHHLPWPLQPAEADLSVNTMAQAHGLTLPDAAPLLHFAQRMDVVVWWPRRLG